MEGESLPGGNVWPPLARRTQVLDTPCLWVSSAWCDQAASPFDRAIADPPQGYELTARARDCGQGRKAVAARSQELTALRHTVLVGY
jgi:hypothetical protein